MDLVQFSPQSLAQRGLAPVATRARGCGNVVQLRGEHDFSTIAGLSAELARAIALSDADLIVDLSEVEFMGSATVGVLVRSQAFLQASSRSLLLRSPSAPARRMLDVCGLGHLLESES